MRKSLRCGAKTRTGAACQSPAVSGKKRCRMHGGAKGSGAPKGNSNALIHGGYTEAAMENRRELRDRIQKVMQQSDELIRELKSNKNK
nr:HGGxSTG domain-containing protein [Shimia gijangensis]